MIYLIRHARPARTGLLLGRVDEPLAVQQIAPSRLPVTTVYSSPLRRARATAAALFPGCAITVLDELNEISAGVWDGLAWSEIETRWPALAAERLTDWWSALPAGAETRAAIALRAQVAWSRMVQGPLPAAVVAHAGINAFLAHAADGSQIETFRQEYLEVKALITDRVETHA